MYPRFWDNRGINEIIKSIILTLNSHSTQCHIPHSLEWGCSVRLCMLIRWQTIAAFSYPKLILKFCLFYCTKSYIYCLVMYFAFLVNKTQCYWKYLYEERLQEYPEKGLVLNSPKLVSGNHTCDWYTSEKSMLNQLLISPRVRIFMWSIPHSILPNYSNDLWVPKRNFSKILVRSLHIPNTL